MSTWGIRQPRWVVPRAPRGWRLVDLLLALAVLVLLLMEVALSPVVEPKLALAAAAALVAIPICWRSSHPGPVAAVAAAGYLTGSLVSQGPFSPQLTVLPLLVLLFNAAARTSGRAALVWGASTLLLTVVGHIASREGDATDFWPWLLWGGAWLTGALVRRRTEAAARHAAHAALLEADQETAAHDAAARERDRIARELHDVVAHAVSVMVVQAGAERLRLGVAAGETRGVLTAIEDAGRQALAELRTMLGVLRDEQATSDDLSPLPGVPEIPALVERLRGTGVDVDLVLDPALVPRGVDHVPTAAELAAYRIVQESLTNVVRHAGRVRTRVRLVRSADVLEVEVVNEGGEYRGQPPPAVGAGRGVVGMAERAAAVGGQLEAGPERDGYRVRAVLPLHVGSAVHP